MGGLQSTNWRQVRAYKRPRPVEDPHVHERPHSMKTGLFRGPNCFHGFSRGDDVEIIAGPTPVPGGDAVQPAEVTHFARIIDPSYCTNPGLVNLLVVQWYHRLHDMVENISTESPSDEVELIESIERTIVQETAIVQRIQIASKPGTRAKYFSTRSTRSFDLRPGHETHRGEIASSDKLDADITVRATPDSILTEITKSPIVVSK